MGPTYAGILGLLAFVVILVRGAIHASSAESVLIAGVGFLIAFAAAGYVIGRVAEQVVLESVTRQFQDEMQNRNKEQSREIVKG